MRRAQGNRGRRIIASAVLTVLASGATAFGQNYKVLHNFGGGSAGAFPNAGLIQNATGNFYGTTSGGGAHNFGTVFKLEASGKLTVLYSFTGGTDGGNPVSGLVLDGAGNLYGTTLYGGDPSCPDYPNYCGTVFKLNATGTLTVLHSFAGGTDGQYPYDNTLVRDTGGNLYGTTSYGGVGYCAGNASGCGTVFKVDAVGKETVLYRFTGPPADGGNPWGGLVADAAGNLYGTLSDGGSSYSGGAVFKVDKTGKETIVYNFGSGTGPDGAFPYAGLIRDSAGNLYGTTNQGGDPTCPDAGYGLGCGTVFKIDTSGNETVLYSFTGGTDGAFPWAPLVRDARGNLYGTASAGGAYDGGTVYKVDAAGNFTLLHSFTGVPDGYGPYGGLLLTSQGELVGTAVSGGEASCKLNLNFGCGIVFGVEP